MQSAYAWTKGEYYCFVRHNGVPFAKITLSISAEGKAVVSSKEAMEASSPLYIMARRADSIAKMQDLFNAAGCRNIKERGLLFHRAYIHNLLYRRGIVSDITPCKHHIFYGKGGKQEEQLIEDAAKAAADADVVLFFGGLNKDYHQDSEGGDRIAYGLPYNQDNVIEALAAANPNLAVCIISGNAVAMPWAAQVPAIVECWYCGSQAGNSIADVVFGKVNPSGKLPFTFPVKIEDSPAHALDAYTCGPDVKYKESIYVGYRWFDTKEIKPLFAFGHGLSYTEFEYSDFKASSSISANGTLKASVKVKNIGSREGKEVVQLYIGEQSPVLDRPAKELKAFEKVSLAPGETKTVKFEIPASDLAYFNAESHSWVLDPAHTFTAYFAAASDDIRGTVEFRTK